MMRLLPVALAAFITATFVWDAAWGQSAWRPEKQVEIILPTAPGGGNDTVARLMQKALQEQKLVTMPILVLNKSGGNQTVSVSYHAQHGADPLPAVCSIDAVHQPDSKPAPKPLPR